jgi:7-cyano-7-deazaguanine synthase in queuosine biosynthesis
MSYTYDFASNSQPMDLEGYYWLNGECLSRAFCLELPPRMADLLDVAMAIYAADRRSPRDFKGANTGQRCIHIRLAVREPALWSSSEMSGRLRELLSWLSEDVWSFQFVKREAAPWPAESKGFLFQLPPEHPAIVSLFSGGLDSLAGLAARAQQEPDRSLVLVSGYTNDRLRYQQRVQVQSIKSAWRDGGLVPGKVPDIRHVAVPFGIHKLEGYHEEKSQRTRALVFLTLGVAAALQAAADTLWVYENGVGALNLPLNETQLGVDNYRGVHPLSLMMVREIFELVLERTIHIMNPFLFTTKAQMCSALEPGGLADLVRDTVSCDGFPQRVANQPQCGYCTSCILRRQSLHAAGLGDYDATAGYRHDVLNRRIAFTLNQIYGLEAMCDQVEKLARCLSSEYPWQALVVSFPQLASAQAALTVREGLSPKEVRTGFIRMYRAYVQEWERLPVSLKLAA